MTIYENNSVSIEAYRIDKFETKIDCNGENLIWIETGKVNDFKNELSDLLDKYRI